MLLMLLITCFSILKAQVKEITFVCEDQQDFPNVIDSGDQIRSKNPGTAVDVIRLLEKRLNLKINIKRVPWKRALEVELKNGSVDGLFTASYNPAREEFGVYPKKDGKIDESRRYSSTTYNFYKLKGTKIDWDGKELKNFKGSIDAPRGYSIVDDLKKKGLTVEESPSTVTSFKKLQAGRVQLVAALEYSGDNLIETSPEFKGKIEKVQNPIVTKPYYFIFSHQFVKNHPELAEKIWNNLKEIREKELNKIMAKYLTE